MLVYIVSVFLYCYALGRLTDAALAVRAAERRLGRKRQLRTGQDKKG